MNMQRRELARLSASVVTIGLIASLNACGGGGGSPGKLPTQPPTMTAPASVKFAVMSLVADTSGTTPYGVAMTPHTDANLVNAWGLAFDPAGFVRVADNGTSKSTLYDGNGVPQSLVVSLSAGTAGTANPTGIAFNGTQDFRVSQAGVSGVSAFIFVGESGTISAWSPSVNATNAVMVVDAGAAGSVYKGAALATVGGANFLYATDFHNNNVDVFDAQFQKTSLPGNFKDPGLPVGYAPYGIQAIGNQIYVTFALQDAGAHDQISGAGLGFVDVFDSAGNFVKQLVAGGALNAPWGVALAPANFGAFSDDLLIANFGDGKINAFNPTTGSMVGTLSDAAGTAIAIDGLWGIAFGNGLHNQPTNTLFFSAGPADKTHGVYGRIDVQ
jgi:uncharacterized protein (TIGR03118 family)